LHFHVSAATGKQNGGRNNDMSASLTNKTDCHDIAQSGVKHNQSINQPTNRYLQLR